MIDLSSILYRAYEEGDTPSSKSIPNVVVSSTNPIVLDGIKFRAKQTGDAEE